MTIYNDRFKTEKDFGTKFCYTLDRALQIFFDRATRWTDPATEGDSRYLARKAEDLLDRNEDGMALTVILPAALLTVNTIGAPTSKKRELSAISAAGPSGSEPKAPKKASLAKDATPALTPHNNDEAQTDWLLPSGRAYTAFFGARMPGLKGWPYFNDNRLSKKGRSRRAPMCVRFQAMGDCTHGCTLAHLRASKMTDADRRAVATRFLAIYS